MKYSPYVYPKNDPEDEIIPKNPPRKVVPFYSPPACQYSLEKLRQCFFKSCKNNPPAEKSQHCDRFKKFLADEYEKCFSGRFKL